MIRALIGARAIASPVTFLVVIWLAVLVLAAVGPIQYPGQPSVSTIAVIAVGISLFVIGHAAGGKLAEVSIGRILQDSSPSPARLNGVVAGSAVLGILGIAFIAIDRNIFGVSGSADYAAFLRCAPEFVDFIDIRRTPLIYLGYLIFSFGFVALTLFLLRAEQIHGWPAYLAQLSIMVPVGYALIYSGRMPVFLALTWLVGVGLVRRYEGRPILPRGRFLLLKLLIFSVVFVAYSNAMWPRRQVFCAQMESVVRELRQDLSVKLEAAREAGRSPTAVEKIAPDSLSQMIDVARQTPVPDRKSEEEFHSHYLVAVMKEAWGVAPRQYLLDVVKAGIVSPRFAIVLMSNYFYLTHSVMIVDRIWQGREHLMPVWGLYEIGVLSPFIRVFFPQSEILQTMNSQLREAQIYGFFPSAWGAAYVDFGAIGGSLYIVVWGLMAGWAFYACRRTEWVTPPLVLSFVLATVLLSPLEGPLGTANSALVLVSLILVGLLIDWPGIRRKSWSGAVAAGTAPVKKTD